MEAGSGSAKRYLRRRATPKFSKSLPSGGRKRTPSCFLPVELDEATLDEAVSARRHRARDDHDSAAECKLRERGSQAPTLRRHNTRTRATEPYFSFFELSASAACLLLSFLFSRPSARLLCHMTAVFHWLFSRRCCHLSLPN